jgi:hypothetical protein
MELDPTAPDANKVIHMSDYETAHCQSNTTMGSAWIVAASLFAILLII